MKTQTRVLVKHYSLIIGVFFISGILIAQNVSAIEKDQARVQGQVNDSAQGVFSTQVQISGSAYNQELLGRDCVLADELICRDLLPLHQ